MFRQRHMPVETPSKVTAAILAALMLAGAAAVAASDADVTDGPIGVMKQRHD